MNERLTQGSIMLHGKMALTACLCVMLSGVAAAAPLVNDPNFDQTPTTDYYHYGLSAWNANGDPAVNPSFAGNVGQDVLNQWNNGTPGNGEPMVGFLSGTGSYIYQAISGFTFGDIYQIGLLVNARVLDALNINSQPAGLQITTSTSAPVYNGTFLPVEAANNFTTTFVQVTSDPFTALSNDVTVTLTNTGTMTSTLLVSGFTIQDIGHDASAMIPEPAGAATIAAGLLGLAALRRRFGVKRCKNRNARL